MEETWFSRDLPVLKAIVELNQEKRWISHSDIQKQTGFEPDTIRSSMLDLASASPPFFTPGQKNISGDFDVVRDVTERARRTAGQWPETAEGLAEKIVSILEERAKDDPDPEKRSRWKDLAVWVSNTGSSASGGMLVELMKGVTGG